MNNEKTPLLLLLGESNSNCLPYKKGHHQSMPNSFLSTMCTGNYIWHFLSPQPLDRPCAISLFYELFCRLGCYYWKAQGGTCIMAQYRTTWDGWISLDETRTILDCWANKWVVWCDKTMWCLVLSLLVFIPAALDISWCWARLEAGVPGAGKLV